ncbi:iron ABC transporter permease [Isoptericola halotolerans]|uniref:FecCD family ABC transporter permease n=1 Tax=Isoptericola halotolerans TaxID=300560 RepID=UPI00388D0A9A
MTTASPPGAGLAALRAPRRARAVALAVLAVVLAALVCLSVAFGSRDVGLDDIVAALAGSTDGYDHAAVAKRIPRTLMAMLAGAALAVAGAVMQGVTRNPLADPGILGVNAGAALAVVVGMAWFSISTVGQYIGAAIAGAAVTAVVVYVIGSLGRDGATPLKLALAGAAASAALISLVNAVVLPRRDIADGAQSWQVGGVGGATTATITSVLPFLLVGFAVCFLAARGLNTLALGDDLATGLGEKVALTRATASAGAVVLCGAVTAVTGPIGFVGLVVPHVVRLLAGPDHRWLLPLTALGGAALVTAADVLGRVVAPPAEIDVGIITALVGAPFFIAIVRRQKVRAL